MKMIERRKTQRRHLAPVEESDSMPPAPQETHDHEAWSVDRKMLVGLIALVVPMAISSLMAFTEVRSRVSVIESSRTERIQSQRERDANQDAELKEKFQQVLNRLDSLDQKMDKVADKVNSR